MTAAKTPPLRLWLRRNCDRAKILQRRMPPPGEQPEALQINQARRRPVAAHPARYARRQDVGRTARGDCGETG